MMTSTPATTEGRLEGLQAQIDFLVADAEDRRALRESLSELTGDLSPVARQGMEVVSRLLEDFDRRGYTDFAKSGAGVVDRIVTSFTQDDVDALGDNVVLILETIKEMTQPDVMRLLQSTFHNVSEAEVPAEPPSMLALLREMRQPEVRRGLARLISVVRTMGEPYPNPDEMRKEQRN